MNKSQVYVKILFVFFLLAFAGLITRLFYWQIIKAGSLAEQAKNQYKSSSIVKAPRGNILASDGSYLTLRVENYTIVANPQKIKEPEKIARELEPFLGEETTRKNIENLNKLNLAWVPIAKKIPESVKKNIESLGLNGISFESEEGRFYPEASVAAQLLGFVGKNDNGDDIGYFGLEGYYDLSLSGKSGFKTQERDALGSTISNGTDKKINAVSGVNLITSIDKRIQMVIYKKLKEGVEKYGAKSGNVVVMDSKTGQILAMEAFPSYDPSKYWEYSNEYFKNPTISDSFEPGSIFKVVIMAFGLDDKLIEPDTICDICDKAYKLDKYLIETWNKEYHPDSTMTEVLVNSDNVGMVFVGQKLGKQKMYDYLDKFGFGKLTGIDLQGESSPALRKKETWSDVDLATTTFGQGIAVTPIQMIRAVGAIANGGILTIPKVVQNIEGDGWKSDIQKNEKVRVISKDAADKVTQMMIASAEHGESKWTDTKNLKVAGKTGTAQIPIAGHYDEKKTNASFIGFAPYDNPKFVMLVSLAEPQSSQWASETAAPLWYSIAKDIAPYLGIH